MPLPENRACGAGPPSPAKPQHPGPNSASTPAKLRMIPSGPTRRTAQLAPLVCAAMNTDPSGPTATPSGWTTLAWVAGPPSPQVLGDGQYPPVPAIVLITPLGVTLRTR